MRSRVPAPAPALCRLAAAFIACCVLSSTPRTASAQGVLDEVVQEVTTDSRPPRRSDSDPWCDDDDESLSEILLRPFFHAIGIAAASPWIGPIMLLEGEGAPDLEFLPAPYWDGEPGFLSLNLSHSKVWSVRVSDEFATNFDDVYRNGVRVVIDTSQRVGVDTQFNHWWEDGAVGTATVNTGDFNLIHRFAQSETMQFHTGLGFNWLESDGVELGINVTYGFDWFPAEPLVLSTTLDGGTLGETGLFHVQSTLGVLVGRAEIYTGIDYHRIGRADLVGCLAGVRLWF